MLPSFLSKLFWGSATKEDVNKNTEALMTAEGEEGWLLVNKAKELAETEKSNHDWDMDSMCSDGSWVLYPPVTFTGSSPGPTQAHSMEDLLIEHPTMSVYQQPDQTDQGDEHSNSELERQKEERRLMNRQRQAVAQHLLPAGEGKWVRAARARGTKKPKLTRKALKKANLNSNKAKGKQVNRAQRMSQRPGKRRC